MLRANGVDGAVGAVGGGGFGAAGAVLEEEPVDGGGGESGPGHEAGHGVVGGAADLVFLGGGEPEARCEAGAQ